MFRCVICNQPMSSIDEVTDCSFCGKSEKADYRCPDGHYICEECRLDSPDILIRKTCKASRHRDPMKLALLLMKHTAIPMHGPEHHTLVACTLLAALRNSGKFEIPDALFDEAVKRARLMPYGSCSLLGGCGAAIGLGVAISIATKASIMSSKERSLSMVSVSQALKQIADMGGSRCCKASVFASIEVAAQFFQEYFGVTIPDLDTVQPCNFAESNSKECLKEQCSYFK